MDLYPIVKYWILPPGGILVILGLAFLLVRGTLGRLLLFTGWSLLLIMSLPALSTPLIALLEQAPAVTPGRVDDTGAQAIVVLGAGAYSDAPEYGVDTVDGLSLQRIRYAAWLHRRTGLPIYVTGGGETDPPAPLMAAVLETELGVPVARVEDQSRTTWENASLTAPLLRADGIDHVLLVTHAWHIPRATQAFQREGIQSTPAPTYFVHREPDGNGGPGGRGFPRGWLPQASAFHYSAFAVHELLGQLYYRLRALQSESTTPRAAPQSG